MYSDFPMILKDLYFMTFCALLDLLPSFKLLPLIHLVQDFKYFSNRLVQESFAIALI